MKTRILALLTALTLALAACGGSAAPPDEPEPPPPPAVEDETIALDTLNVEFAVDGRDADALLALQKAFPAALTDALAKQNVTVETVNVTFGSSGEATETALRGGAVQLAFLSVGDYLPYRYGELVALERGGEGDDARGLVVFGSAEPHIIDALRAALPELAPTLASYAAEASEGVYEWDAAAAEALLNS